MDVEIFFSGNVMCVSVSFVHVFSILFVCFALKCGLLLLSGVSSVILDSNCGLGMWWSWTNGSVTWDGYLYSSYKKQHGRQQQTNVGCVYKDMDKRCIKAVVHWFSNNSKIGTSKNETTLVFFHGKSTAGKNLAARQGNYINVIYPDVTFITFFYLVFQGKLFWSADYRQQGENLTFLRRGRRAFRSGWRKNYR